MDDYNNRSALTTGVKKSLADRICQELAHEDAKDIRRHIVDDVIVPKALSMAESMLHDAISIFFGGRASNNGYRSYNNSSYTRSTGGATRVSSTTTRATMDTYRPVNPYDLEKISWDSMRDAAHVLSEMRAAITQYTKVSINDYYDIGDPEQRFVRKSDIPAQACNFGWVNLATAKIITRDGRYYLDLPTPINIK